MKRFKSTRQLQRFVSIHDPIANLHHFPRNKLTPSDHRACRNAAIDAWREIACLQAAPLSRAVTSPMRGATIVGETRLLGARFGGDIDCTSATLSQPGGYALRLNRAIVDGAFFLRQGASVEGTLDLTATSIGAIDDEQSSWPKSGDLLLNRCQYGAFIGGAVNAASRLDWLSRQTPERWSADPYEQLSTVLREMGHDEDARAVLITKERLQRRARRARAKNSALRVGPGHNRWHIGRNPSLWAPAPPRAAMADPVLGDRHRRVRVRVRPGKWCHQAEQPGHPPFT